MKRFSSLGKLLTVISIFSLLAVSCSKDNETPPVAEQQITADDLELILDSEETTGVVDDILADIYANDSKTGKYSVMAAKENDCYVAEYTQSGFTVTFDNCVIDGSDLINGVLEVIYSQSSNEAAFTANYADFQVGDVLINGTKSFSMHEDAETGSVSISITSDMRAEFANGDIYTEVGTKTITVTPGETMETSTVRISGEWKVTMNDHEFIVYSENGVEGNFACEYLVSGEMTVSKNGLVVTIDFGDGSCDNKATVIYPNGATEEIELRD